jgi:MSHA biogenesis protein MshJ
MIKYIDLSRKWYQQRNMREKLLTIALSWACLYAIFSLAVFWPLNSNITTLRSDIRNINNQINTWNLQLNALGMLANSPLYKEWSSQHQSIHDLQQKYKVFSQSTSSQQWLEVIKNVLQPKNNVTLAQVKNAPEIIYNPFNASDATSKLYQQQISLTVYGNYFDIINYLRQLEIALPNIRWDSLAYQVIQYPVAKVDMEFSIFYDKSS